MGGALAGALASSSWRRSAAGVLARVQASSRICQHSHFDGTGTQWDYTLGASCRNNAGPNDEAEATYDGKRFVAQYRSLLQYVGKAYAAVPDSDKPRIVSVCGGSLGSTHVLTFRRHTRSSTSTVCLHRVIRVDHGAPLEGDQRPQRERQVRVQRLRRALQREGHAVLRRHPAGQEYPWLVMTTKTKPAEISNQVEGRYRNRS